MFMTAGIGVSAAGSTKVTGTANAGYSQGSNFDDFEVDHLYWTEGEQICRIYGYTGSGGDVVIPNGVNWIQGGTFENCTSITSVTIPDSVTDIGSDTFSNCKNLKSVSMGKSVEIMGMNVFEGCTNLTSINIPNSLNTISEYTFYKCTSLKSITLPNSVTTIEYGAFKGCTSLTGIKMGNSVKTIEDHTFDGCSELATITIPESVTSIGADTFKGCESLMDIYYTGTKDKWDKLAKNLKLNSYTTVHCATELKILTQPSNVTAKLGSNVSFTVKAQGDGLKYQWYYMKAGAPSWTQWGSRTTATTTATANESWDGMRVYCKVMDKYGKTVKSNPATVTVTQELKITKHPVGATVRTGEKVTLSLRAEGMGLTYQWYYKKAGQTAWSIWNVHTKATETVTVPASWDGIQLYCKVSDKTGKSVNSNTVKIILSDVLAVTQQPTNKTVALGNSVTLSLKAKGENLTYQWYYKKATATAWNAWNGRTHASETVTPNESWNGIQLYCKVSDKSGNSLNSSTVKLILSGVITVTQQPTNKTVLLGKSVTLSLKAEGAGLTYQWYYKKAGESSFSAWNGRTHASESVTPNVSWNGMQLYCLIKDSTGKSVKSNTVKVTVTGEELKITAQPTNKTVKLGNSLTVSLTAQGSGLSYQWYYKKTGQSSFSAWGGRTHASETCKPNETWNGMQLYCLVKDAFGKSVKSNTIKITVTEIKLKITRQPTNLGFYLGDSVTVSLEAQGTGLTYQWYYRKYGQETFSKWNGRTHASETVTPNESWFDIRLYCIVKDASGKSVKSITITLYDEEYQGIMPGEYRCYSVQTQEAEYGSDIVGGLESEGSYVRFYPESVKVKQSKTALQVQENSQPKRCCG